MAKSETQASETLTVTCLTCHERIGVQLTDGPQAIACTFCGAKVSVPSREVAQREHAARKLQAPTAESYELAPEGEASSRPARKVKLAEKRSGAAPEGTPQVSLECPTCHERVQAAVGEKWGKVPCTFCGVTISVPDRQTVLGWKPKKVAPRKREEIGEYAAGPVFQPAPPRAGGVFDKLAEVRQEPTPAPPTWTFFSGVFTVPWHKEVIARWVLMSIGFTAMFCVGLVLAYLARQFSGIGSGIAAAFFLLPIIWIGFLTLSYTAACSLCVLESTAGGLDRVDGWPEPNWREWMPQMFYLAWIAGAPSAICYGVAVLLQAAGLHAGFSLILFFVLYPISLMSALEANTVWVPLTFPILGSLVRWWWCWLAFYILSGALVLALLVLGVVAIGTGQTWLVIALGPLVPAVVLIYARLLGRLGWRMTAKMPRRAKKQQVPSV